MKLGASFGVREAAIAAVVVVAIVLGYQHFHRSTATANPDTLATEIGAAWCEDSGYQLENRLDSSKAELYDCNMRSGAYKCVTDEQGVARDVTAEARLVFASTLGSSRPDCVRLSR